LDDKLIKEAARLMQERWKQAADEKSKIYDSAIQGLALDRFEQRKLVEYCIQEYKFNDLLKFIDKYELDPNRIIKNGLIGSILDNYSRKISEEDVKDIERLFKLCKADRIYRGGVFNYHMIQQAVHVLKDLEDYHKRLAKVIYDNIENKQLLITDDYGGRMPLDSFLDENGFEIFENDVNRVELKYNKNILVEKLEKLGFIGFGNIYEKSYSNKKTIFNRNRNSGFKTIEVDFAKEIITYLHKKSSSNYVEVKFIIKRNSAVLKFSVSFDASFNSLFTNDFLIEKFKTANSEHRGVVVSSHEYDIDTCKFVRSHSAGRHNGFEQYVKEAKEFLISNLSDKMNTTSVNIFTN